MDSGITIETKASVTPKPNAEVYTNGPSTVRPGTEPCQCPSNTGLVVAMSAVASAIIVALIVIVVGLVSFIRNIQKQKAQLELNHETNPPNISPLPVPSSETGDYASPGAALGSGDHAYEMSIVNARSDNADYTPYIVKAGVNTQTENGAYAPLAFN